MSNSITFRLTNNKKDGTWSIRGGSAKKNGVAKFINYWPGSDSIFDEDNKKNAIKPETVVFRYNDILSDPGVEIIVPNENKVLIDYLKAHPFYGVHYKIHNQDEIDEQKSKDYDKIEEALSLIKETDDLKIQAIALAVFGIDAYGWISSKCKASLKARAVQEPEYIIKQINATDYESKYLSALAFYSGIVSEDYVQSTVIWNDPQKGTILHIAKGESGIMKLAELLATSTKESRLLLQEIGSRISKATTTGSVKSGSNGVATGKTEAEIRAEIYAEVEEKVRAELAGKEVVADDDKDVLKEAQAKYKEVMGKNPPPVKLNDLDWINERIASNS